MQQDPRLMKLLKCQHIKVTSRPRYEVDVLVFQSRFQNVTFVSTTTSETWHNVTDGHDVAAQDGSDDEDLAIDDYLTECAKNRRNG